jgi:hypothetical protein
MRSRVAALATDSQYVILPLVGITTTSPGSEEDAEAETRHPSGSGSDACFEWYGRANVKVSGEGMLIVYGQTNA